jgi:hypothetical protein
MSGRGSEHGLSPRDEALPVEVRTRFDRFPATIKGAWVMRGADGNPHAVDLHEATVDRIPSGPSKPVPVGEVRVDVAPSRDLFVPFEVPITDLDPGWYIIRAVIRVDAGRTWSYASRAFTMPWSRGEIRRGSLRVDQTVRAGEHDFVIEAVELGSQSATVVWRASSAGAKGGEEAAQSPRAKRAEALLMADGVPLEVLPPEAASRHPFSHPGPEERTTSYPLPRAATSLAVVVKVAGDRSDPVDVPLP